MEHTDDPAAEPPLGRRLFRVFGEFADLIEIEGSDPRKASAYRRAALALRDSPEPVDSLAAEGRLTVLPGIGPVLAAKIDEFVRTGTLAALEALRAQVPAGVAGLLEIRGVGPRLAAAAWRELGVTSVAELKIAAADGRLASLPGVGPGRARRVLEAIAASETAQRLLGEVLPVALALRGALVGTAGIVAAEAAGAARRGCPLVERAELVAAGDAEAVRAALASAAEWAEAPAPASSAAGLPWPEVRGTLAAGPEVRVVVAPGHAYGTALLMATGSPGHLAEVEAWRQARGASSAPFPLAADEPSAYAALGLPWIPPELREGRGEVAAAAAGALAGPLLEAGDLQGDLHCHTTFSDGTGSLEAMAAAARARGYRYLAVTDHTRSLVVARGMSLEALAAQRRRIDELNAASDDGFVILQGAEVEILRDGSLDYPDEALAGLDFCVASLHNTYGQSGAELTGRLLRALEHPAVDLIGHPTGRRLGRREAYPVDVPRLVEAARQAGKAIEVNGSPERLDLDAEHNRLLPPAAVPAGCDSDAHSPAGLAAAAYAVLTARRGGLRAQDVLNVRPVDEIRAWKRERGRA